MAPTHSSSKAGPQCTELTLTLDCNAIISAWQAELEETVKAKLRIRAAHNGRSMEEEAREILKEALMPNEPKAQNLAQAIRRRIEPLGGVELASPERQAVRRAPDLT